MTASILLVGYGAVGIVYAYILERSGQARVTAIARSNYQEAQQGVLIRSTRFGTQNAFRPFRVVNNISDVIDEPYDYVVVATKAIPEVIKTSDILAPFFSGSYIHELPVFVLMQNGLGVERDLYEKILSLKRGPPKIISAAVWILTNMIHGSEIEHGMEAKLGVGVYRHERVKRNTPEEHSLLMGFTSLIEAGGGACMLCEEIQSVKFGKNMWNATFASFSSFTRTSPTAFFANSVVIEAMLPLFRASLEEIMAVGRAMGFDEEDLPSSNVETGITITQTLYSDPQNHHRPSMLLDVENDKPFELEAIVGEIIREGRRLGVPMPKMETVYALLTVIQQKALAKLRASNIPASQQTAGDVQGE